MHILRTGLGRYFMATIYYVAHDPLSNSEAVITEYDSELLKKALRAELYSSPLTMMEAVPSFQLTT